LVTEVVNPNDPNRDYGIKRQEYARAGIPEYWIVDRQRQLITVLILQGRKYVVFGEFAPGMRATSKSLDGFSVDVTEVFAAAG
jgi:Uma2 family endonuclease